MSASPHARLAATRTRARAASLADDRVGERVEVGADRLQGAVDGARRSNHLAVTVAGQEADELAEARGDGAEVRHDPPSSLPRPWGYDIQNGEA